MESGTGMSLDKELTDCIQVFKPQNEERPVPGEAAPDVKDTAESGWAAVAKSIRDIDEQKIRDYKEDIDTILVFAGLYSAVLTALLAESVQSLQPDQNAIMVALLNQLVVQTHTYTINTGALNSTAPPLDVATVQQFQPTRAAERVNVLWFASLTLSLISASFGILVKQWLREYLSGEYISPRTQLRIRFFRAPGLTHWGVFSIAALLPLVLQLSLALFFVGLCFFTVDIHYSIGYTTIPLVAGWAVLFIAASFSPVLSPRCPYKIPFFKYVMWFLRAGLFNAIRRVKGVSNSAIEEFKSAGVQFSSRWNWRSLAYTEEDAAGDGTHDLDILIDVDTSQKDDRLLAKMCSALKEERAEPKMVFNFVLKIIESRLNAKFPDQNVLPAMLDLSHLPAKTCTILMDSVADVLEEELRKEGSFDSSHSPGLRDNCLAVLSSRLPCLLSGRAMSAVSACLAGTKNRETVRTVDVIMDRVDPKDCGPPSVLCLHVLGRLQNALFELSPRQVNDLICQLLTRSYCTKDPQHTLCRGFYYVFVNHQSDIPPVLRHHTCSVLTRYMLHQVKKGVRDNEWLRAVLVSIYDTWYEDRVEHEQVLDWHSELTEVVLYIISVPEHASGFYLMQFDTAYFSGAAARVLCDSFCSAPERPQILIDINNSLHAYLVEKIQVPGRCDELFFLHLLKFISGQAHLVRVVIHRMDRPWQIKQTQFVPRFRDIWRTLHVALRLFDSRVVSVGQEHVTQIMLCFSLIEQADDVWVPHGPNRVNTRESLGQWMNWFNPDKSFYDDQLVEDLMRFLPEESLGSVRFRRVRRILWKQGKHFVMEDMGVRVASVSGLVNDSRGDSPGMRLAVATSATDHTRELIPAGGTSVQVDNSAEPDETGAT